MFLRLASGALAMGVWRQAKSQSAYMSISKQDTTVRVLVDITPDSIWEIQKSTDSGKTWITLEGDAIIISSNEIQWDIPIVHGEPAAIFRLKQVTATMTVAGVNYQFTPNAQSLYAIMAGLTNFTMKSRRFTGLGQFITELNGTAKGGGKNWILFVNGQSTNVGASQIIPKAGDKIEWRLV